MKMREKGKRNSKRKHLSTSSRINYNSIHYSSLPTNYYKKGNKAVGTSLFINIFCYQQMQGTIIEEINILIEVEFSYKKYNN